MASDHNHRFTGKPMDSTGLYYYGARFYDPTLGRFINMDPAKDGLNWYVYCNNNPLKYVDPDGKRAWLIHGTFSDEETWTPEFREYLSELFNEPNQAVNWNGRNSDLARRIGAMEIANTIYEWHKANEDEPIRIIGHSHGGNVGIMVANELAERGMTVSTLVTIGTPSREYQLTTKVGQHINVYNKFDAVQILGGNYLKSKFGRTMGTAVNVEVSFEKSPGPIVSHSVMHSNAGVWDEFIYSKLK